MQRAGNLHVRSFRLDGDISQRDFFYLGGFPISYPARAVQHLSICTYTCKRSGQMAFNLAPFLAADRLPDELLMLLAAGSVLPSGMLRRPRAARQYYSHPDHRNPQAHTKVLIGKETETQTLSSQ